MNNRRITWLAGLLVIQLLVVAALLVGRGSFREPETGPLLTFDPAAIDRIRIEEFTGAAIEGAAIEGGAFEGGAIELHRSGDRWLLTAAAKSGAADAGAEAAATEAASSEAPVGDVPADLDKVDKLLEKLAGLKAPWPVATSATARERFEVTDENRQRLVRLQSGGQTAAELLLGTSPGFRRLHVRIPGMDEVYEVDLTHFELSVSADEWVDRALLAAAGDVAAVAREGFWRLARSDDGWMLDDGAADSAAAEQMAARFANLRVLGVAETAGESAAAEPVAVFVVTDTEGQHRLSLYAVADAAEYVLVSDRQPGRYRLAAFVAEQLLVEDAALLPAATADEAAGDAEAEADPTE